MVKRFASCPAQSNSGKDVSVDRYIDKMSRFSAPNQIKDDFIEKCEPPLERLSQKMLIRIFLWLHQITQANKAMYHS